MREILFRGKRLGNGEWVEGYYAKCQEPINHGIGYILPKVKSLEFGNIICIGGFIEVIPDTIGQYTGLTDRNGTRIFEGDIVEVGDFNSEDGYGEIMWDEQTARFAISGSTNILFADFDNYFGNEIEVIGNIHDNPELLK